MTFEEALTLLKNGTKITNPSFYDKDEYFMGCYVGFPDFYDDNGKLIKDTFEEQKARGMSIVKMKGDYQHPDMQPKLDFDIPWRNALPSMPICLLMDDKWEIWKE